MNQPSADAIPLFAALKEKDRARILGQARHRTYAAGDVIVREGDEALYLFIVADGHARVERDGQGVVGRLGPGDFFGELALIEEHARTATVIADDELTAYLIPAWDFRSLLVEHPEMAVPMLRTLIARLHGREHHGR
jgi:CRP-like cAMP-binding protein